jgi:hypothetical protein
MKKNLLLYWSIAILLLIGGLWVCIYMLIQKGHDLTLYPVVMMTMVGLVASALGISVWRDNKNNDV